MVRSTVSAGVDSGKQTTIETGCPLAFDRCCARALVSAISTACARTAMVDASSSGLATVNINAAVSPKSLLNLIGPAPDGRLSEFNFKFMSLNSFLESFTVSESWTCTIEIPGIESDLIPKSPPSGARILGFCAMVDSIGRVTSCSTCSAVPPGYWVITEATRTGMSGSLRLGICW